MDTFYHPSVSIINRVWLYLQTLFSLSGLGKPLKNDFVSFQQDPKEEGKLSTGSKVVP